MGTSLGIGSNACCTRALVTRNRAHAVLANLKAQNSALHVTTERLVDTNSEIMARLNKQSEHVIALQEALAAAQASQPPRDMQQKTPGMRNVLEHVLMQDLHGRFTSWQAWRPPERQI